MRTLSKVVTFHKQTDLCIFNKNYGDDTVNHMLCVELLGPTTTPILKPGPTTPSFQTKLTPLEHKADEMHIFLPSCSPASELRLRVTKLCWRVIEMQAKAYIPWGNEAEIFIIAILQGSNFCHFEGTKNIFSHNRRRYSSLVEFTGEIVRKLEIVWGNL